MLSLDLARSLRAAGVRWDPQPGDRFVVPDHDLDDQVFVLSDMVVQTMQVPGGSSVLAFNGTTEWALDSLEADEALWIPREDQLRALLGGTFVSLERVEGEPEAFAVVVRTASDPAARHVDVTADSAYARALLSLVE